jgi:CBS domain-containing protein
MKQIRVGEIMAAGVATVAPEETVRAVADRFASGDPHLARHRALPIVDRDGHLMGIVTQGDILRVLETDPTGEVPVIDAGVRSLVVAHADERAFEALTKMLVNNIGRLPVVDRADPRKMVGYVNRATLMASWGQHLQDESLREMGWYKQFRTSGPIAIGARHTLIGRVVGISGKSLRVRPDVVASSEKSVANTTEEFALLRPVPGISLGDHVGVSFHDEDGHHVVQSIDELHTTQ